MSSSVPSSNAILYKIFNFNFLTNYFIDDSFIIFLYFVIFAFVICHVQSGCSSNESSLSSVNASGIDTFVVALQGQFEEVVEQYYRGPLDWYLNLLRSQQYVCNLLAKLHVRAIPPEFCRQAVSKFF